MKLAVYASLEASPNATTPYSIRLRKTRPRVLRGALAPELIDTLTPAEARKLARHLLAVAKAAEKSNGVRS